MGPEQTMVTEYKLVRGLAEANYAAKDGWTVQLVAHSQVLRDGTLILHFLMTRWVEVESE